MLDFHNAEVERIANEARSVFNAYAYLLPVATHISGAYVAQLWLDEYWQMKNNQTTADD